LRGDISTLLQAPDFCKLENQSAFGGVQRFEFLVIFQSVTGFVGATATCRMP
jgi:hypothetical protein